MPPSRQKHQKVQFLNSLDDKIRQRGVIDKLISDSTQSKSSARVKDMLRSLFIDEWQSEAYHQHQNVAGRSNQTVKQKTNTLLDRTSAPAFVWFLKMGYFYFVLNHIHNTTIKIMPSNAAKGSTCNISSLCRFYFC